MSYFMKKSKSIKKVTSNRKKHVEPKMKENYDFTSYTKLIPDLPKEVCKQESHYVSNKILLI